MAETWFGRLVLAKGAADGWRVVHEKRPSRSRLYGPATYDFERRFTRPVGRYVINLIPDRSRSAGFRLEWSVHPAWDEWAQYSEGSYVLRTNITD